MFFPSLSDTAHTFEEARSFWAKSKDGLPHGPGHAWMVELLKADMAEASSDQHEWYRRRIWEAELLARVIAMPTAYRSPL